jgi:hypothetical protein
VTTNTVLAVDGGGATARSYFTVLQAVDQLPLQPILAGRYLDAFERRGGGWHFASREITVDRAATSRATPGAPAAIRRRQCVTIRGSLAACWIQLSTC